MTLVALLTAAATPPLTSGHLNPVKLFLDADIVVQAVMAGLILASVWVWTIIVSFSLRIARVRKACDAYETDFWKARDVAAFQAMKAVEVSVRDGKVALIVPGQPAYPLNPKSAKDEYSLGGLPDTLWPAKTPSRK